MTGYPAFDWAILSVSLFNAILTLWLGMTVLLNAEHRSPPGRSGRWGFWIAGASFLLGSLFFFAHTAVLALGFDQILSNLEIWWSVGWLPLIALPFAWYMEMLWYAGFWEEPSSAMSRRHRPWFFITLGLSVAGLWIALSTNPLTAVANWESGGPTPENIPIFLLLYPIYIVLCVGLALDAQRKPGPTSRLMGEMARERARPWMNAAAIVFVAVCLLVGYAMAWILLNWFPNQPSLGDIAAVMNLDLVIATLIGVAIILIGQSIVAYEVFTGHILPRRGLTRYWRNALALAAGFSLVVGGVFAFRWQPVFGFLLMVLLAVAIYALLVANSYGERDAFIASLRPFIASQQLLDRLTVSAEPIPAMDAAIPFRALCGEILGAKRAVLLSLGSLSPLWGPPLVFPKGEPIPPLDIRLPAEPPYPLAIPWTDDRSPELRWMVPLWSQRGPIGALLLGDKSDGGLYAREDFEIAQSACERLLDSHASAELARRLVALQRERRMGSQISDRRTRRVLHDEILPALHATLLALDGAVGGQPQAASALQGLASIHQQIARLLHEIPPAPAEIASLGLAQSLRRVVDSEIPEAFDSVEWKVDQAAITAADSLPDFSREVLYFATRETIRNSALHARGKEPARPLHLEVAFTLHDGVLEIRVEDDGVGFSASECGSPTQGAGGHGLALHGTMMAVIGGELNTAPRLVGGTLMRIRLPL
jgi:signal transduction histidine kinase